MTAAHFVSYTIERFQDIATVTVARIEFTPTSHIRTVLACYETLGRGATASARREVARHTS